MELVTRHWSGKHKQVVCGINLITLMWTDGDSQIPCDYRIYNKQQDNLTKNDHFHSLIATAHQRGFTPECVMFDSWYSSLKSLKTIRQYHWHGLTQLKPNRQVNRPIKEFPISETGTIVAMKGYGFIKVFRIVSPHGSIEYWATSNLSMNPLYRLKYAELSWSIELYHRGIKQFVGVERCFARRFRSRSNQSKAVAQRTHIGLALRAFLRLERHCFLTGISWFEAKTNIIRKAVRAYLAKPIYNL